MRRWSMHINGLPAEAGNRWMTLIDPATEEPWAQVPEGGPEEIDAAVRAARHAFDDGPWGHSTAQDRCRVLLKLAAYIRAHAVELAELDAQSSGKPIVEAEFDIADAATCFEYFAGAADKITGMVNPVPDRGALNLTLREPVGVAGQIIPWNYPLLMAAWKLAPALAAGCTCVLKPAEPTPLSALRLAEGFAQCGLPPGVVNIVTGPGDRTGAELVRHPSVDKIAFTGSSAVGRGILREAADSLKRVTLELGGKSPNIFFADTDLECAVDGALFGVFLNQGEVCSAGSRILVQRPLYARMIEALATKAASIHLGPPLDRSTKMGPLVTRQQYDRVLEYIALGKLEGRLLCGGGRSPSHAKGYYVQPTIFADVDNRARIAQEEIFGPVAVVIPFEDEAEALHLANDSPYGLAAAIWTRDVFRVLRMMRGLKAGVVWVNHMQPTFVEAPWGGYKHSGIGRELGPGGVDAYLETKQVHLHGGESPIGWY